MTGVGGPGPVAFVTAMPLELRPFTKRLRLTKTTIAGRPAARGSLDGRDVVAIVSGIGTALATSAVEDLLAAEVPSLVVMVGIAGAVDDETPIGAVVVPARWSTRPPAGRTRRPGSPADRPPASCGPPTRSRPRPSCRPCEQTAWSRSTWRRQPSPRCCEREGVPWSSVRAISDRATDGSVDDAVLHLSRSDGTPDLGAALRYVLRHPGRVPTLVRFGRGSSVAATAAAGRRSRPCGPSWRARRRPDVSVRST